MAGEYIIYAIMNLLTMEAQPNFPHYDISDLNASILELMLQNSTIAAETHRTAETHSWLFRLGHRAIYASMSDAIENKDSLAALSTGVSTYEAISSLVRPIDTLVAHNDPTVNTYFIDPDTPYRGYLNIIEEAREQFDTSMARTSGVVTAVAQRRHASYTDYAVTGAALAYLAERDVTKA